MAIGTTIRIAGLAAITTLAAGAALSAAPPATDQLAEAAAAEVHSAVIEIVAPKAGADLGTIRFGVGHERHDNGLRFGGPR
jgi:hypothetical protein